MAELNEPPIIKYEEIVHEKTEEDEASEEESSSTDEEVVEKDTEETEEDFLSFEKIAKKKLFDSNRNKNISRVLDFTFSPRKIERDGKEIILRLSREPAARYEIIELSETFDKTLKQREIKMQGFCPLRRELYDLLFDELIRQSTINCPMRGSLLLRARDEFRMTMAGYEKLYENGVVFGTQKALQAEVETKDEEIRCRQLEEEVARAQNRIHELRFEISAEEEQSCQRMDMMERRHEEKMDFQKKANKQLKEQINCIFSKDI